MIGRPLRFDKGSEKFIKVHSNGPVKQYIDGYVIERLLLMVEKGRLDQIQNFINTYSMNELDESKAIFIAAKYSQFDVFKYLLSHVSLKDDLIKRIFLHALSLAIGSKKIIMTSYVSYF